MHKIQKIYFFICQDITLLKQLVYKGASNKILNFSDGVIDRIAYELSVIEGIGAVHYFILYARIIESCNELNLLRSFERA